MEEKLRTEGIHNHFSKFITDTLKVIWAIIIVGLINVFGEIAGELGESNAENIEDPIIILGITAVLLVICVIIGFVNYLRWKKTVIMIIDDDLVIKNDFFLNKKVTTVRLSSIATVNYQRSLFDYVFGTYRLQVDINSSITANETDFNLVFDKETAEAVKAILIRDRNSEDVTAEESQIRTDAIKSDGIKSIASFSFSDVIRHCLLSVSLSAIIISLGAAAVLIYFALTEGSLASVITSLLFVVLPILWSQINPLINYYGFTIEKQDNRAIVSYGLITRRQYNLPLDKTNAIIIHQPVLARIFGYYYGELINVGMGDQDNNGIPIFCLLVKKDRLAEIIKELKPELEIRGLGEASPRTAFIPVLTKYMIFAVPVAIVIACFAPKPFSFISIPVLLFTILSAVISYRTKSLAVLSDKTVITYGVFHKMTTVVPNTKIQNLTMTTGPVCRSLGLAHGSATILASYENTKHDIGYFKTERFDKLFENITYCD